MTDDQARLLTELAPTPFVSSWLGRARPADLTDHDPARRAAGWAHWAISSLTPMRGNSDRPYVALTLPAKFYDPRGKAPEVAPHLEIPAHLLQRPDPEFPDRLAQMGNALQFPWWLVPEVTAAKRALFTGPRASVADVVECLNDRRASLAAAATTLTTQAGALWDEVEETLVADPASLSLVAAGDFTSDDVNDFFPAAADLALSITFDERLRQQNQGWVSRRVGVWKIHGDTGTGPFTLGVLTPRLTRASLLSDPLFAPASEAPAALLVRALILRRLLDHYGTTSTTRADQDPRARRRAGTLRAVVAHTGHKLPEASVQAAVKFLTNYPDADDAWAALTDWSTDTSAALTVSCDGYKAAHRNAQRAIRRAEEPQREDINIVLPLAWSANARVVRVTYSATDTTTT